MSHCKPNLIHNFNSDNGVLKKSWNKSWKWWLCVSKQHWARRSIFQNVTGNMTGVWEGITVYSQSSFDVLSFQTTQRKSIENIVTMSSLSLKLWKFEFSFESDTKDYVIELQPYISQWFFFVSICLICFFNFCSLF